MAIGYGKEPVKSGGNFRFFATSELRRYKKFMANGFAYLVLFTWPIVVAILFSRLPLRPALVWSIVAGYLLLPTRTGFDLPVLPPVDKTLVLALSAAIMCISKNRIPDFSTHRLSASSARGASALTSATGTGAPSRNFKILRGQWLFWGLLILLFASPFVTYLQNPAAITKGTKFIPAMSLYDAFSINLKFIITLIPFLLARRFLATDESHAILLRVLALSILAYSVLMLYEIRMSPQLNRQIYGFFPHTWSQHVRDGGYRPLVFLDHGLWLAILVAMAVLSAAALHRVKKSVNQPNRWLLICLWLLFVLVISKSLGALLLTILLLPFALICNARKLAMIAALFSAIVMTYPILRSADLVPVDKILGFAEMVDEDRAASLQLRLENEDRLLAHAREKPLAGWGIWGRARVFNEAGRDISTTDGYWVIILSSRGWLGYIGIFGALGIPLILLGLSWGKLELSFATSGLGVVLSAAMLDLLPNATIGPIVWLLAGSMIGRYQTAELRSASDVLPSVAKHRQERNNPENVLADLPGHGLHSPKPRPVHTRRPRTAPRPSDT